MAKTILFQGDSLTDCNRSRQNDAMTGTGYATMVKGALGVKYPGAYSFINRGVGGSRITDVYTRIKSDIINLKPDYMSLLIGVNDVWHEIDLSIGVSAEKFERIYEMLIEEVLEALPDIKIMILEPFVLKGEATASTEAEPDRWEIFRSEVEKRAVVAKRVAEKYHLTFVPLQGLWDNLCEKAESTYWLEDGVHPTAMGHYVLAGEWMKAFEEKMKSYDEIRTGD